MPLPNTPESLHRELSSLGLRPGMTVMVHSSLGKVGWTVGGRQSIVSRSCAMASASGLTIVTWLLTTVFIFPVVGNRFAASGAVRAGCIGHADALLFSTRELVDFARLYFLAIRS